MSSPDRYGDARMIQDTRTPGKRMPDVAFAPLSDLEEHFVTAATRTYPPRTKRQLVEYHAALLHERMGYVTRGETDQAAEVDAELTRSGWGEVDAG